MTKRTRLKFDLYHLFLNADQGSMTAGEHVMFHQLALDMDVVNCLERQNRHRKTFVHRPVILGQKKPLAKR